jgi:hypothetical protein
VIFVQAEKIALCLLISFCPMEKEKKRWMERESIPLKMLTIVTVPTMVVKIP